MGVRQSFSAFWSLETFQNSSDTSGRGWMVGGTGEGENIIRAWTKRKKARVERKGGEECFTSVSG